MNLRSIGRVALDQSLKLARAPIGTAVKVLPGRDHGPRAVAERLLERADSSARVFLGGVASGPPARPRGRSVPPVAQPPTHEEIAARAFEMYEHGEPGDAAAHWHAAERELSASRN